MRLVKLLPEHKDGYRDLYWCWVVNEPTLLSTDLEKRVMYCIVCKMKFDHDKLNPSNPKGMEYLQHEFIGHIPKPQTSDTRLGTGTGF
jgi:hypothetical protein